MIRRRWVIGGLIGYLVAVGLILVLPVSYSGIVHAIGDTLADIGIGGFGSGWVEFTANIVMFVPLGFLLTLLLRHHWWGIVLAIMLSVAAEVVQVVIPSREPSLRDILANGLGAAIGGALAWLVVLRRDGRRERTTSST
ncbi:VanZ family protein [Microbacterium invictum]|uniref:Glycopeptide antibiotics resistance protein n=1 Tax=Microbacterium invictum TaxID=515415 RepID=A0AA40SPN7_9MICO|nr:MULTISPECIES: VanZ family protein [Microbacterium]MBB4140019.1 glycopeptide antibiotics resistance protein [Microbacterium invictum]